MSIRLDPQVSKKSQWSVLLFICHVQVSQLSKVGGRNNKDCVHKVMDRY